MLDAASKTTSVEDNVRNQWRFPQTCREGISRNRNQKKLILPSPMKERRSQLTFRRNVDSLPVAVIIEENRESQYRDDKKIGILVRSRIFSINALGLMPRNSVMNIHFVICCVDGFLCEISEQCQTCNSTREVCLAKSCRCGARKVSKHLVSGSILLDLSNLNMEIHLAINQ